MDEQRLDPVDVAGIEVAIVGDKRDRKSVARSSISAVIAAGGFGARRSRAKSG
jgi:hypothetical protein